MLPHQTLRCPPVTRRPLRRIAVLLACTLLLPAVATAQSNPDSETVPARAQTAPALPAIAPLLQQLNAPEFTTRQQAATQLQQFAGSADGIKQLGDALAASPTPEIARRILDILEHQFSNADISSPATFTTAEILEQAAQAERWDIAETTRQTLDRLWTTRVNVAVVELVRLKVPLRPQDPRLLWQELAPDAVPGFQLNPNSNSLLRIFIDQSWPQTPRAMALLQRLAALGKTGRVSIYSIQGHPLTPEQLASVKAIFGDTRVQDRGPVCLGILQEPIFGIGNDSGVLIGQVEKGSSADNAGLAGGDLITKMNDEKLTDFEDLVTRLKQHQVGDKIRLEVIRSRQTDMRRRIFEQNPDRPAQPATPPVPREVVVTLQGWYTPDPPPPPPPPAPQN